MSLTVTLRSELLKTRKASVYLTLIGAAVGPVIYLFNILLDEDELKGINTSDPVNALVKILSEMNTVALFPLFIILICTLLPQIEYRNNTWKQLFTSPQTKAEIFFSKFMNVQLLMLIFLITTHVFIFLALAAINILKPELHLFEHPIDVNMLIANAVNAYVVMLAVSAIQFLIGLRSKNFIVPIGIGFALWLIGTIMGVQMRSSLVKLFPYSFQAYLVSPKLKASLTQIAVTSVIYAVFFLIIGCFEFRRQKEAE